MAWRLWISRKFIRGHTVTSYWSKSTSPPAWCNALCVSLHCFLSGSFYCTSVRLGDTWTCVKVGKEEILIVLFIDHQVAANMRENNFLPSTLSPACCSANPSVENIVSQIQVLDSILVPFGACLNTIHAIWFSFSIPAHFFFFFNFKCFQMKLYHCHKWKSSIPFQ